jgi:hypothetical protein
MEHQSYNLQKYSWLFMNYTLGHKFYNDSLKILNPKHIKKCFDILHENNISIHIYHNGITLSEDEIFNPRSIIYSQSTQIKFVNKKNEYKRTSYFILYLNCFPKLLNFCSVCQLINCPRATEQIIEYAKTEFQRKYGVDFLTEPASIVIEKYRDSKIYKL